MMIIIVTRIMDILMSINNNQMQLVYLRTVKTERHQMQIINKQMFK